MLRSKKAKPIKSVEGKYNHVKIPKLTNDTLWDKRPEPQLYNMHIEILHILKNNDKVNYQTLKDNLVLLGIPTYCGLVLNCLYDLQNEDKIIFNSPIKRTTRFKIL